MIMSLQVTVGVVCWMYGDEEAPEPGDDTEAEWAMWLYYGLDR